MFISCSFGPAFSGRSPRSIELEGWGACDEASEAGVGSFHSYPEVWVVITNFDKFPVLIGGPLNFWFDLFLMISIKIHHMIGWYMLELGSTSAHPGHWLFIDNGGFFECKICSSRCLTQDLMAALPCAIPNRDDKVKNLVAKEQQKIEILRKIKLERERVEKLKNSRLHTACASPASSVASPRPPATPMTPGLDLISQAFGWAASGCFWLWYDLVPKMQFYCTNIWTGLLAVCPTNSW